MMKYYVLGVGQEHDRAIYFTNTESAHGGEYWGDITEAYLFNSMQDVCEHLVKHPEIRCFISEVGEEAIKRCKAGKAANNEYTTLYRKMNTVSYMMNSK